MKHQLSLKAAAILGRLIASYVADEDADEFAEEFEEFLDAYDDRDDCDDASDDEDAQGDVPEIGDEFATGHDTRIKVIDVIDVCDEPIIVTSNTLSPPVFGKNFKRTAHKSVTVLPLRTFKSLDLSRVN